MRSEGMDNKEMLISLFIKGIGELQNTQEKEYGENTIHTLNFLYKNKINVKLILFELENNCWIVHHDVSRENPILLKKIAHSCERIQRIKGDNDISIILSDELEIIKNELFIKTAVKSFIQNILLSEQFTVFGSKGLKIQHNKKAADVNPNLTN